MRFTALLLFAFLMTSTSGTSQNYGEGQDANITLADKLLASLGGKELWKNTRSLHLKEHMWPKQLAEKVTQEIWRDLKFPGTKIHLKSKSMDRIRAWDSIQGWGILENGRSYTFDSLRVKNENLMWKSNLFTICRKLANNDANLIVKEKKGDVLEIYDHKQLLLCTITLNATGAPIKWTAHLNDETESYIYGPLKSFGAYNLPTWWTSPDGHWQFEYITFEGLTTELKTSFLPPPGFTETQ